MNRLEMFKVWAPEESIWSPWAKPVIFANIKEVSRVKPALYTEEINFSYQSNTIVILDLKDAKSINYGLAFAKIGYQVVPLYNSVSSKDKNVLIDLENLENHIFHATNELKTIKTRKDANPVFLLDSRRMDSKGKLKNQAYFDNRWSVFPQDMPSSHFLKEKGIEKIVIFRDDFTKPVQNDLSHILFAYQKAGILIVNGHSNREIKVKKPTRFSSAMYRLLVTLRLKRNSAGGFGGKVPDTTQHGSGRTYYGIG